MCLQKYGRSYYSAVKFRETLSAAYQNKVLRHPIAQRKLDLNKLQAENLIPTCIYMGTNLKPLP